MLAVNNPAEVGKVQVWNQLSEWHSIEALAIMIQTIAANRFDLEVEIQHIDTPRKEFTGEHYYYYVTDKLRELGYEITRPFVNEIGYMFETLLPMVDELFHLENVVEPKIGFTRDE